MLVKKIVFVILVIGSLASGFCDTVKRSENLGVNGKYLVDWEANLETEIVVFTLSVETTGYVGFGISMNPHMEGADIVIGGVSDDRTTYFADYHAPSNPQRDESQDWELISATESNQRTVLKISRKLNTCDDVGVVPITDDTQYMIWAIGYTDNIGYHGVDPIKRGPKINNLLDAPTPAADLSEYEIYQVRRNHEILPVDTSYWCTIHNVPNFDGIKHHVIADKQQNTSNNPVIPSPYCKNVLYIWAVGGEMLVVPEMTGYPIGDSGRQEYFMFEVHIDNPALERGSFETGIDLFYTKNLREIDAAVFGIAHAVNHLQIVPPRTDNFVNIGQCSSDCTSALVPKEGMTLINVMFRAHRAGKKMRTRIIRDGIEQPWLAVDNYYNFDYQANRPFQEFKKILPGDHLITESTYDTTSRPNVTIGGHPSMYEMCQTWFWHFPKSAIYCDSTANPDLNKLFGIESYNASQFDDEPILTKPDAIAGLRHSDYLNTLNWTDDLKNQLQEELVYRPHEVDVLAI